MARVYFILLIGLGLLSPYLYDVGRALSFMVLNAPENLQPVANFKSHAIRFADDVRNCEDVVIESSLGVALLSCSPGRDQWNTVLGRYVDSTEQGLLYLYRYQEAPNDPPTLIAFEGFDKPFHPLGLAYHRESKTLAVANHGGSIASIEVFTLDLAIPRATFRQTISDASALPTPNSLVFLNRTHLYASNTHQRGVFAAPTSIFGRLAVLLATLEQRSGLPFGSVSLVNLETGNAAKALRLAFANGVDLLDGGKMLAVASSIKTAVYLYNIDKDPSAPSYLRRIKVPFFPDNLSVDDRGHLLVAGHPHPKSLDKMATSNWRCSKKPEGSEDCVRAPSWVVQWDPMADPKVAVSDVFVGTSYAASSGVARDTSRNLLMLSGLYERGILIAQE